MTRAVRFVRGFFVAAVWLCALSLSVFGGVQGTPDGFDSMDGLPGGDCCRFGAVPNLPLPTSLIELPSAYACFADCRLDDLWVGYTFFQTFTLPSLACDEAIFRLETHLVRPEDTPNACDPNPANAFTIDLRAKYVETWTMNPDGDPLTTHQIWRWIVHGNAVFEPAFQAQSPCPTPQGVTYSFPPLPFDTPPYTGFVDLARIIDNGVQRWEVALALTHRSGCTTHSFNYLINGLQLSGDPTVDPAGAAVRAVADRRHYHLVAPRTECPPYFDFTPSPPIQSDVNMGGPNGIVGTFRSTGSVASNPCNFENDAVFDTQPFGAPVCHCGQGPALPGIHYHETVTTTLHQKNGVFCGDAFHIWGSGPTGTDPSDLPTGYTQLYVGKWLPGTKAYVGPGAPTSQWLVGTAVFNVFGVLGFNNPCYNNAAQPAFEYDFIHGVTTLATQQNTTVFVDVPHMFHPVATRLNLQLANSVNGQSFTVPGRPMVVREQPCLPASTPIIMTGLPFLLKIPGTESTSVWSFGR